MFIKHLSTNNKILPLLLLALAPDLAQAEMDQDPEQVEHPGTFHFRDEKGHWAQLGLGYAAQKISGLGAGPAEIGTQTVGVLRLGAGGWWQKWSYEGFLRTKAVKISDQGFNPRWFDLYGGYRWELENMHGVTPVITGVLGLGIYSNTVSVPSVRYLQSYVGPLAGIQIRFIGSEKFAVGSDLIVGGASRVSKLLITADLRYWWKPKHAVGAGYWADFSTQSKEDFNERTGALELYYRVIF